MFDAFQLSDQPNNKYVDQLSSYFNWYPTIAQPYLTTPKKKNKPDIQANLIGARPDHSDIIQIELWNGHNQPEYFSRPRILSLSGSPNSRSCPRRKSVSKLRLPGASMATPSSESTAVGKKIRKLTTGSMCNCHPHGNTSGRKFTFFFYSYPLIDVNKEDGKCH